LHAFSFLFFFRCTGTEIRATRPRPLAVRALFCLPTPSILFSPLFKRHQTRPRRGVWAGHSVWSLSSVLYLCAFSSAEVAESLARRPRGNSARAVPLHSLFLLPFFFFFLFRKSDGGDDGRDVAWEIAAVLLVFTSLFFSSFFPSRAHIRAGEESRRDEKRRHRPACL